MTVHCRTSRVHLFLILALSLAVITAACGEATPQARETEPAPETSVPVSTGDPSASPSVPAVSASANPTWFIPPSLEEQIFYSDVIVRASFLSLTATTETVSSTEEGVAPVYRPVQELRFTAHEYLQGSGPNEVLVVVEGDDTYPTEEEARRQGSERNTAWDDRQGVLFLRSSQAAGAATSTDSASVQEFSFVRSNPVESAWDYSVDNLSRAWLPANGTGGSAQSSEVVVQEEQQLFITDGSASPLPTVSLAELKEQIGELAATLAAGEGIPGYVECIAKSILNERVNRADPTLPSLEEKALDSGLAAGTEVYNYDHHFRWPQYDQFWVSGPDAELFQAVIIDDDESSANGYYVTYNTARPLPAGVYDVRYNVQPLSLIHI